MLLVLGASIAMTSDFPGAAPADLHHHLCCIQEVLGTRRELPKGTAPGWELQQGGMLLHSIPSCMHTSTGIPNPLGSCDPGSFPGAVPQLAVLVSPRCSRVGSVQPHFRQKIDAYSGKLKTKRKKAEK